VLSFRFAVGKIIDGCLCAVCSHCLASRQLHDRVQVYPQDRKYSHLGFGPELVYHHSCDRKLDYERYLEIEKDVDEEEKLEAGFDISRSKLLTDFWYGGDVLLSFSLLLEYHCFLCSGFSSRYPLAPALASLRCASRVCASAHPLAHQVST
jgi:hypothetical protein